MSNEVYADKSYTAVDASITTAKNEVDIFSEKAKTGALSEAEMIQYNMAASRYSTMVSLGSALIKNLTDTEKQVANKM
jgi:hypothetical protein